MFTHLRSWAMLVCMHAHCHMCVPAPREGGACRWCCLCGVAGVPFEFCGPSIHRIRRQLSGCRPVVGISLKLFHLDADN